MSLKLEALKQHLTNNGWSEEEFEELELDDIEDADPIEVGGCEYLVLTDKEADQLAADYIRESVWAFNAEFILPHTPLRNVPEAIEMIQAFQEKCEDANDALVALITDMAEFIDDAIAADGRGHFLATYDSEEWEYNLDSSWYYVYRLN